jgi:hypothetical protein
MSLFQLLGRLTNIEGFSALISRRFSAMNGGKKE